MSEQPARFGGSYSPGKLEYDVLQSLLRFATDSYRGADGLGLSSSDIVVGYMIMSVLNEPRSNLFFLHLNKIFFFFFT